MNLEELARRIKAEEIVQLSAELGREICRVEALEEALLRYGQHETGCRYGEQHPSAECTCGLEAAINGSPP